MPRQPSPDAPPGTLAPSRCYDYWGAHVCAGVGSRASAAWGAWGSNTRQLARNTPGREPDTAGDGASRANVARLRAFRGQAWPAGWPVRGGGRLGPVTPRPYRPPAPSRGYGRGRPGAGSTTRQLPLAGRGRAGYHVGVRKGHQGPIRGRMRRFLRRRGPRRCRKCLQMPWLRTSVRLRPCPPGLRAAPATWRAIFVRLARPYGGYRGRAHWGAWVATRVYSDEVVHARNLEIRVFGGTNPCFWGVRGDWPLKW